MAPADDAASQHSTEASLKERRPSLTDSDAETVCRASSHHNAKDVVAEYQAMQGLTG